MRSANRFVHTLKTPTWYFNGAESPYIADARQSEQRAQKAGAPFQAFIVQGGDHFNILRPLTSLLADKIAADTGPACDIKITEEEVAKSFANAPR